MNTRTIFKIESLWSCRNGLSHHLTITQPLYHDRRIISVFNNYYSHCPNYNRIKNRITYSLANKVLAQKWSPNFKCRGCDTVLPDCGYSTPQGASVYQCEVSNYAVMVRRGNLNKLGGRSAAAPYCPPRISHEVTRIRKWGSVVNKFVSNS
jgi:hypothetical protein